MQTPAQQLPLMSPRTKPLPAVRVLTLSRPLHFAHCPMQTPQTPRSNVPSAGPGSMPVPSMPSSGPGAPSGGPGTSPQQISPRGMTMDPMRASDPHLSVSAEPRGRAMSRSESGLARPSFLSESSPNLGRPEPPAESPLKLSRSGTRQALVLKKEDTNQLMPPTPRSRGKVELQEDVNIWDEAADSPANFITEKQADNSTAITGGSFNKLVEKLTWPNIDAFGTGVTHSFSVAALTVPVQTRSSHASSFTPSRRGPRRGSCSPS